MENLDKFQELADLVADAEEVRNKIHRDCINHALCGPYYIPMRLPGLELFRKFVAKHELETLSEYGDSPGNLWSSLETVYRGIKIMIYHNSLSLMDGDAHG